MPQPLRQQKIFINTSPRNYIYSPQNYNQMKIFKPLKLYQRKRSRQTNDINI